MPSATVAQPFSTLSTRVCLSMAWAIAWRTFRSFNGGMRIADQRVVVDPDLDEAAVDRAFDGDVLVAFHLVDELGGHLLHDVDLALLERGGEGLTVGVDLEDDLIDLGFGPPVVLVGGHAPELALLPLDEAERARRHRIGVLERGHLVDGHLLPHVLGQDVDRKGRQIRIGRARVHHNGVAIDLDIVDERHEGRQRSDHSSSR